MSGKLVIVENTAPGAFGRFLFTPHGTVRTTAAASGVETINISIARGTVLVVQEGAITMLPDDFASPDHALLEATRSSDRIQIHTVTGSVFSYER